MNSHVVGDGMTRGPVLRMPSATRSRYMYIICNYTYKLDNYYLSISKQELHRINREYATQVFFRGFEGGGHFSIELLAKYIH